MDGYATLIEMFWSYYGILLYFGFISIMIMLYFVQIYFAGSAVLIKKYYVGSFILLIHGMQLVLSLLARAKKKKTWSLTSQMLYRIFGFNSVLWTYFMTQMDILLLEEGKMMFCFAELPM